MQQLFCGFHSACHAACGIGQDQLCTIGADELLPLAAHVLLHDDDRPNASSRGEERKGNLVSILDGYFAKLLASMMVES